MINTRPKRLGMLAPSSNTVLEPETQRLLPADCSVVAHVSRLRVVQISDDDPSLSQFELDAMLESASLLADAAVDIILWNGTAASWLGFDRDHAMVAAIEAKTGIPATTAIIALNERLTMLGARRLGLVTPYVEALESRIIANYRAAGREIVSAARLNLTRNLSFAEVAPATIANMVRDVAKARVDAILILCTNLAGAGIASALSDELGVPVLDSVKVALEHCLARLDS
jgi:maleate isomerase